jgi:hypothetical protein
MVVLSYRSLYNSITLFESPDPRRMMTYVTRILNSIEQGDAGVAEELLPFEHFDIGPVVFIRKLGNA